MEAFADSLNPGLGWTDSPALNKNLVIAGLLALASAALIARPSRADQEPGLPTDPQIA
uniref:hypothetical protein n=1 Tax=Paractinoplanes polyasparticus TaxID=2856853 RepID=UPI001C852F93|nr:hypothetical protein [Actinoplanes polyasparticus]